VAVLHWPSRLNDCSSLNRALFIAKVPLRRYCRDVRSPILAGGVFRGQVTIPTLMAGQRSAATTPSHSARYGISLPTSILPIIPGHSLDWFLSPQFSFWSARILPTFSAIANRPMYSWTDSNLGGGIVGGSLAKIKAIGVSLGNLALGVLRGKRPESIPGGWISAVPVRLAANEGLGVGMDKIPAGSRVINRDYSF
jgi:hypothetical protein